jgi:hypothetical protein
MSGVSEEDLQDPKAKEALVESLSGVLGVPAKDVKIKGIKKTSLRRRRLLRVGAGGDAVEIEMEISGDAEKAKAAMAKVEVATSAIAKGFEKKFEQKTGRVIQVSVRARVPQVAKTIQQTAAPKAHESTQTDDVKAEENRVSKMLQAAMSGAKPSSEVSGLSGNPIAKDAHKLGLKELNAIYEDKNVKHDDKVDLAKDVNVHLTKRKEDLKGLLEEAKKRVGQSNDAKYTEYHAGANEATAVAAAQMSEITDKADGAIKDKFNKGGVKA